jgi:hypothetical protein
MTRDGCRPAYPQGQDDAESCDSLTCLAHWHQFTYEPRAAGNNRLQSHVCTRTSNKSIQLSTVTIA